jgi:D-arabinose 1-dehydrogenase-like Zn-dependent alcohol dehydrogenase
MTSRVSTPKVLVERQLTLLVDIHYCGICGSDIHTAASGWGDMSSMYPMVVGHEIVGKVVKAGPKASHKEGDLVGIGAQCDSCLECQWCKEGESFRNIMLC